MQSFLVVMDETEEAKTALRYAARRAARAGGGVEMLAVVPPQEFVQWSGVQDAMEEEARLRAEAMLVQASDSVIEEAGIKPDLVVGTSAGSVVASLYASGRSGAQLQAAALNMDEAAFADWILPLFNRGVLRGEALARYVDTQVGHRLIENMALPLGIVATDLNSGQGVLFRRGDTGTAVRASSAVPAVFLPVKIGTREYVRVLCRRSEAERLVDATRAQRGGVGIREFRKHERIDARRLQGFGARHGVTLARSRDGRLRRSAHAAAEGQGGRNARRAGL